MLIEPVSPVLANGDNDDVTLRLRLRELLDPPITDWPGQAQAEAARQLRQLVAALQPVTDALQAAGDALGEFPPDDDGDDAEGWAHDVADLDRLTLEHDANIRKALLTFDEALADLAQG